MEGKVGSDDLVRIIPNAKSLLTGYLFSLLSSDLGQIILKGLIHGSVQQKLPPEYLMQIKLPLPSIQEQLPIHELIEQYGDALSQASEFEDQAQAILSKALQT